MFDNLIAKNLCLSADLLIMELFNPRYRYWYWPQKHYIGQAPAVCDHVKE